MPWQLPFSLLWATQWGHDIFTGKSFRKQSSDTEKQHPPKCSSSLMCFPFLSNLRVYHLPDECTLYVSQSLSFPVSFSTSKSKFLTKRVKTGASRFGASSCASFNLFLKALFIPVLRHCSVVFHWEGALILIFLLFHQNRILLKFRNSQSKWSDLNCAVELGFSVWNPSYNWNWKGMPF